MEDDIKFEYPERIFNELKFKDLKGKTFIFSYSKFDELAYNEFQERIKFIDIWLAMEQKIEDIVSYRVQKDKFIHNFIKETILSKITFYDKILILKTIFKVDIFATDMLNFSRKSDEEIIINKFQIKINKIFEILEELNLIRNQSAHSHKFFIGGDIILKQNRIDPFKQEEINKEILLIKSHFILWIFYSIIDECNRINQDELEKYYKKYEKQLFDIAKII